MKIIPHKVEPLNTKPFFYPGGQVGCLLIHGFTGIPDEMNPVGQYLADKGLTVSCIQLPGHGTLPDDMIKTGWKDWTAGAERGLFELREKCSEVFVGGVSMGGALALYLAARYELPGAISLAGAAIVKDWRVRYLLPVLGWALRYYPKDEDSDFADPAAAAVHKSYEYIPVRCVKSLLQLTADVRENLPKVKCPLLIIQSHGDKTLTPDNAQYIYDHAGSEKKELIYLEKSGHVITMDYEKDIVFSKIWEFISHESRILNNPA